MKTVFARPGTVRGDWFVVDASDKTLGRLASQIAHRLKGKHKADYSPHVDMGDHIVVVNAQKVRVTGRKLSDKIYYHHTGHIVGIKSRGSSRSHSRFNRPVHASDPAGSLRYRASQDRGGARVCEARQRAHRGE